jgi:hypothetical protein
LAATSHEITGDPPARDRRRRAGTSGLDFSTQRAEVRGAALPAPTGQIASAIH